VEGALQTGINAVCAVIRSLGGSVVPNNPLDNMSPPYDYSATSTSKAIGLH